MDIRIGMRFLSHTTNHTFLVTAVTSDYVEYYDTMYFLTHRVSRKVFESYDLEEIKKTSVKTEVLECSMVDEKGNRYTIYKKDKEEGANAGR